MSPTTYFFTAVLSPTARPAVSHRAAFAKTAHFATKTGQVAMTDLCREWGMSKTQVYEILKRWRTEETVATKPRSGRALTDADTHTSACQRSAKVTSRGNRSRRFSQREQVSVCLIKLCIILVKQLACAHFGDDWKSGLIERPLSFCRIRIRRARSFASSVHAPSARLHARIRALGRCVRDHSSLSRGHRRRGHEPTYSRSRRVVISFVSFVSDVLFYLRSRSRARSRSARRRQTRESGRSSARARAKTRNEAENRWSTIRWCFRKTTARARDSRHAYHRHQRARLDVVVSVPARTGWYRIAAP